MLGYGQNLRPSGRSDALDAIRGIAIAQVVCWHFFAGALGNRSLVLGTLVSMTWSGVDLFFCLSGFLIAGIIIDQKNCKNFYSVFYARRACRIIPLYLAIIVGYLLYSNSFDIVYYLSFTQNVLWALQGKWGPSWTGVTWSLAVEEQFYLVLPLLIRLCRPRFQPIVFIGCIVLAPLCRQIAVWYFGNRYAAYLLLPCRMDALFSGVLVAWAIRQASIISWIGHLETCVAIPIFGCALDWFRCSYCCAQSRFVAGDAKHRI